MQVWNYLKNKVNYKLYKSEDEYFHEIELQWNSIPNNIIHNFYSSFLARCQICYKIGGNSLNGHWKVVRLMHDLYRTKLIFVNGFGEIEVPA